MEALDDVRPPEPQSGRRDSDAAIKMVTCILRPERLDAAKEALNRLNLVGGMTVSEVRGFGRQRGQVEHYRGEEYTTRFFPKVRVELAVHKNDLEAVLDVLSAVAPTGQIGDGKVFVTDLLQVMRVRTGERGTSAL